MKKDFRKDSMAIVETVVKQIEKVSGKSFGRAFNDLVSVKSGKYRRIKGVFGEWIDKKDWSKWKEKIENVVFDEGLKVEFNNVNKLMSMGGKRYMERNRKWYVENGEGSVEDYNNTFNNEDYYFIIKISEK